jgi:VWFA-related protein
MKSQSTFPAQTQGRKDQSIRPWLLGRARSRSLSTLRPDFAPLRLCGSLLVAAMAMMFLGSLAVNAQEPIETIRIQTRVVFLDALVKDKRTGIPISDLKPENFQVFDDGQPRAISYFTREGQARKPLALVIILDCAEDGAGRFLKRPEILKAMSDELAKLPPGDEVAIMAMNIGEDEKRIWLTDFTSDRNQIVAALAKVPAFVEAPDKVEAGREKHESTTEAAAANSTTPKPQSKGSLTVHADTTADTSTAKPATTDDVVETETIKGKNGATVPRTIKKDGSVSVKRTSGNGHVTVELDDIYDMAAAVRDASRSAGELKPNSQTAIVWVSDGIAPIFFEDRDETEKVLIRDNVIFNSLTVDLKTLFKLLLPIGKPIAGWMGVSLYGSAKRLAQRSGGEAVRVNRVSDYGSGLAKVIGNLTARYSLGFSLAEDEKLDGRLHSLEIRVKAEDAKGKTRKLIVSSRQGYYMPTDSQEAKATANRSQ